MPIGDLINKSAFIKELKKWRKIQHMSEQDLARLQRENLRTMLKHCKENVPFYQQLDVDQTKDPFEQLKLFPLIKKSIIKENLNDFLSAPKESLIAHVSSGSSGIQGVVYMNKKEQSVSRAMQILWWEWSGYKIGSPIVQTGITDKRSTLKAIKDKLFQTTYTAAFGHSEDSVKALLNGLDRKKGFFIGGYASSIYVFADVAKKHKIYDLHFQGAISWGDKLFPKYKKLIESQFHTQIRDTYGCTEGVMMAAQKDLPYHYIMTPHVHMEIVDEEGKEVPDGTLGFVLVTRLDCFSMPLVRYYLGDLAIKLPRKDYPEKRDLNFPLLQKIIGRDTDIVKTQSGKFMVVHFFTGILEFYPQIRQFKVIQHDLSSIIIEFIPEKDFTEDILREITEKIQGHLKENFKIDFKKVNFIAPSKSGKPQIIESHLKKAL